MGKQFFAGSIGKLVSLSLASLLLFSALGAVEAHRFNGRYATNMNNSGLRCMMAGAAPEIEWGKNIRHNIVSGVNGVSGAVQQTSDGGYIIEGTVVSANAWFKTCLIKTDAKGNELWHREFGDSKYSLSSGLGQQTEDGGYIIVGIISHAPRWFNSDIFLLKTDASGNLQWCKTFHITDDNWGDSVQQTTDGGYIIAGKVASETSKTSFDNGILIKTDAKGNTIWESIVDAGYRTECTSVQQTADGGYIVTGLSTRSGEPGSVLLYKTDANGYQQWEMDYGSDFKLPACGNTIKQTADGGYIVTGVSPTRGMGDICLLKTNVYGVLQWEKHVGGCGTGAGEEGRSVQKTKDGGYLVVGCIQMPSNHTSMYIFKTDTDGNKIWDKTLSEGECYSAQQTADGGYIVEGRVGSSPIILSQSTYNNYLVKLSPESP